MHAAHSISLRERPTPHKLAVCVLLLLYTRPQSQDEEDSEDDDDPFLELDEVAQRVVAQRLARFLRAEISATERASERTDGV